mgnify:CR=1 FL=1
MGGAVVGLGVVGGDVVGGGVVGHPHLGPHLSFEDDAPHQAGLSHGAPHQSSLDEEELELLLPLLLPDHDESLLLPDHDVSFVVELPLPHVDVSFDDDAHVDASFDEPDDDPLHLLV